MILTSYYVVVQGCYPTLARNRCAATKLFVRSVAGMQLQGEYMRFLMMEEI